MDFYDSNIDVDDYTIPKKKKIPHELSRDEKIS